MNQGDAETALNAELDDHLDYEKHSPTYDSHIPFKHLIADDSEIQLGTSRDRDASC